MNDDQIRKQYNFPQYHYEIDYQPIDPTFVKAVTKKNKDNRCDHLFGKKKFSRCKNKAKFTLMITYNVGTFPRYKTSHLCKKHFHKAVKLKKE